MSRWSTASAATGPAAPDVDAMIFAAGEGRRLRPLTDETPKALVEVGGRPMLERVARALIGAGADRLIVNAHHHADRIEAWLAEADRSDAEWVLSREDAESDRPLETGGGLVRAAEHFRRDAPFFLHNVDILTDLDLAAVYAAHVAGEAADRRLATLVVTERPTSRPLLVDDEGVCGRLNLSEGWEVVGRHPRQTGAGPLRRVGFSGVHVVSPRLFAGIRERGTFSIVDSYLRLVGEGETIAVYDAGGATWHDIGTPERLEAARRAFDGLEGGAA